MKVHRQPRPLGLTLIAQSLNKSKENSDDELISKLLTYIIKHNLTIGGKRLSIETLSLYLNKPVHIILRLFIRYNNKLSQVMLGNRDQTVGALFFLGLKNMLEDKALVEQQAQNLIVAQGVGYKPYLSSAVNDILATNLHATDAFIKLAKAMMPSGPQNAIQINNGEPVGAIKAIGINEAMAILEAEGITKLSYSEDRFKQVSITHNLSSMPQVNAKLQHADAKEIPILSNPLKESKLKHKTRRALEEGINEEEDTQII